MLSSVPFIFAPFRQIYKVKWVLKCDSRNVIYLITCKCCGKQYVASATGLKEQFKIQKNDINTGKARCGVANHLLNVCRSSVRKFEYLQLQLIEKVFVKNDDDADKFLWGTENFWQARLLTLTNELNNPNE